MHCRFVSILFMHVASMPPSPPVKTSAPSWVLLFLSEDEQNMFCGSIEADGTILDSPESRRESVTSLKFSDEKILRRGIDATISTCKNISALMGAFV